MSERILPDELPGINIKKALEMLGLEEEIFKSIIKGFVDSNSSTSKKIQELFDNKDYDQLCKIAHTLKGSSGNICADQLHQATLDLEISSKNRKVNQSQIDNVLNNLNILIKSVTNL